MFRVVGGIKCGDTHGVLSNPNWALERTKEGRVYRGKNHKM